MTWAFDVTAGIPRALQSGTDSGATPFAGIDTAIAAVGTVARSAVYTTASPPLKPPSANGMWYRCSQNGTTGATPPTYDPTSGNVTTDGTAKFTAFRAPTPLFVGTGSIYFMPEVRVQFQGTLTNTNPQQQTFWCWDLIGYGGAANFTSGAWCADGVTPKWDGLHFVSTRVGGDNSSPASLSLQAGAKATFIGGEVQVAAAMGFDNGTEPKFYQTRLRGTKDFGAASIRIRNYTTLAVFQNCEFFDIAFDLFRMPAVAPSIKARGAEYVYQYVGAGAGGADAKFVASNLENPDGTYDFDNYFGGWVELEDCAAGHDLKVYSQYPNSSIWVKHCVPLYQNVAITPKDTSGALVPNVRFTCTDEPTNSPTVTFTTAGGLKTWDFRNALGYQTASGASSPATARLASHVWYWQATFKKNPRFPLALNDEGALKLKATFEGRAYKYKTLTAPVFLSVGGASAQGTAGMVAIDTPVVTSDEATALAQTKFTFTPSGATGGSVTATASYNANELWDAYRAWIVQYANRPSNDTWTAIAGKLNMGAWTLTHNTGVTGSAGSTLSYVYAASITLNGTATMTMLYGTSVGDSSILRLQGVSATGVVGVWHPSTSATELFQTNNSGSVASYDVYYPPSSVGLVKKYARELYGSQRVEGSITLAAGLNTIDFVDIPDVGVTQTNAATVNAYATIEGPSKRYDRTAVFRLTEQGIKLGQIATRSGTSLEGTFSVVVRDDAPAVYAVVGNVITIKAASYDADVRFVKEVVTGGGTFTAFDTELIDINIEDSNGDSTAIIAGTTGGLVDVWKCVNGTINADFATGTKIASNLSAGKFRFTGVDGYKLVFYDKNSLVAQDCSMSKGTYTLGWYIYTSPTGGLTQDQNVNFATMVSKVNDIFSDVNSVTTGFVEATDSLHALRAAVDTKPALADMEASTILANKTDVLNVTASVWSAESRTLTSAGSSGATLAEIEASTVLAKQTDVAGVPAAVRTELSTELGRVDVAVSTRSTLTAQDIPEGLTAAEVWAATERTLTETPGLTNTQAEQLRKVAQLHGVGAELVVTETTRTAGDVSQTLTTDDDGNTTVSAA